MFPNQGSRNPWVPYNEDLADQFIGMFEKKIHDIVSTTAVENNVYNGTKKINEQDKNFTSECNILFDIPIVFNIVFENITMLFAC